jgi:transcriptional regulator with XRE-family HTH domain
MINSTEARISHDFLKWARERLALTLEEAADKIEVPVGRLAKWEKGKGFPTFDELTIISEVYGLPMSMFYLSEWPDVSLLKKDPKAKEDII